MSRFLNHTNLIAVMLCFVLIGPIGCGGPSKDGKQPESPNDSQEKNAQDQTAQLTGPAAAVHDFLEASRRGDDKKVTDMLTAAARTGLAKYGLSATPKASDTAQFMLGEVQIPGDGVARVASRWIETDMETGESHAEDATWLLRKEPEGWRIAGMARNIFPGEPPLLLNFEDPEDMIHQAEMLKAELARRAQAAQTPSVARSPSASPNSNTPTRR